MLTDAIVSLIRAEQARQQDRFVEGVDFEAYLAKLGERAEILADTEGDRCRGVVAFYANDRATRQAFITMVLVDPLDRGLGLGRALVACVLELVKRRGFASCRLEVAKDNAAAHAIYRELGFKTIADRGTKDLMSVAL